jgi:hypothetical protein
MANASPKKLEKAMLEWYYSSIGWIETFENLLHPTRSKNSMTQTTLTINRVIESDLLTHIEDTKLYWTTRNGHQVKRFWNELSATEKQQQREAEARAAYNDLFNPCGIY